MITDKLTPVSGTVSIEAYIKTRFMLELQNLWILTCIDESRFTVLRAQPFRANEPKRKGIEQFWTVLHHARTVLKLFDVEVNDLKQYANRPKLYLEVLYTKVEGIKEETIAAYLYKEKFMLTDTSLHESSTLRKGRVVDLLLWFSFPSLSFHKGFVYETLKTAGVDVGKADILRPLQPPIIQVNI